MTKIIVCGGHLSPALAIIEKLRSDKNNQIYYFGRKNALEGDKAQSLELVTMNNLQIPFYSIISARFQRIFTRYTLSSLLKLPLGMIMSLILLVRLRPQIVISFGGYISLPVSLSAWMLGIPIITHEQTHSLGLANKIISRIAKVLCLSFEDTDGIPKGRKTILTGNPIRESLFANTDQKIIDFGDKNLPLIFITGGNLGSRSVNLFVEKIIPVISSKYRILHQCGNAYNGKDYANLIRLKNSLPAKSTDNYMVTKQINPSSMGTIYKNTSLVIGRAGANTVAEILYFALPSILIPLPWAGNQEQEKNALSVKSSGIGEIILQKDLTSKILLMKINSMMRKNNQRPRQSSADNLNINVKAGEKIVNLIQEYANISK